MQAATLAIAALSIALVTAIISILSYFRERRIEITRKELEDATAQVEEANGLVRVLTNMTSVILLESKNISLYYDTIESYISDDEKSDDKTAKLAMLSVAADIANSNRDRKKIISVYQLMVQNAKEIIKDKTISVYERELAYIELLVAYYNIAIEKAKVEPDAARADLEEALKYVKSAASINPQDSFGYFHEYIGLIYLWYSFTVPADQKRAYLTSAIENFTFAIERNENKASFYNDRAVAYIQRLDAFHDLSVVGKAQNDLKKVKKLDHSFSLAYLNCGDLIIKQLQAKLGIVQYPFIMSSLYLQSYEEKDLTQMMNSVDQAIEEYKEAEKFNPSYPNNFYKRGEAITYKILLLHISNKGRPYTTDQRKQIRDLETSAFNQFLKSMAQDEELLGCMYCTRNFYELTNQLEKAKEINAEIKRVKKENAIRWEELLKGYNYPIPLIE